MIRYAQHKDVASLIKMWEMSFSDTAGFIRFYFEKVYKEEETIVYSLDNKLVAALQMIPYQIKSGNNKWNASYISGAMTHPGYRKQGFMEQLIYFAFGEMKTKGIPFSFLIPQEEWLFGFYQKYGYKKAFPLSYQAIELKETLAEAVVYDKSEEIDTDMLYADYIQLLETMENVVLKTKQQFLLLLQDFFNDGGCVFVAGKSIAFAIPCKGKLLIKEMLFTDNESKEILLSSIKKKFRKDNAIWKNEYTGRPVKHTGMIKRIDDSVSLPGDIYMNMMFD